MIIVIVIIAADLPRGVDNAGRVRQHLHHHRLRHLQPPLAVKLLAGLHLPIYLFLNLNLNLAIMMMMMTIFRLGSTLISFLGYFRSFKSPSMAQFGQTYADDVEDGDMMIIVIIFVTNISMTIIYMTSMNQVYSVGHH